MIIKQICSILLVSQFCLTSVQAKNADTLKGSKSILKDLSSYLKSTDVDSSNTVNSLLKDITLYRNQQSNLSNEQSAKDWLALAKRAQNITQQEQIQSINTIDSVTEQSVGIKSVIASLPSPEVWSDLQAINNKAKHDDTLETSSIDFIIASLNNDQVGKTSIMESMQALVSKKDNSEQYRIKSVLNDLQKTVIRQGGDVNEIIELLESNISNQNRFAEDIELPDLVTLLGKEKAELWLRKQLTVSKRGFYVNQGDQTQELVQQIALELSDKLLVPHWGLVKGLNSVSLYEKMTFRFGKQDKYYQYSQNAKYYYLLSLIATGKTEKASKFAHSLDDGSQSLYIPSEVFNDLEKLGYTEELYSFFNKLVQQPVSSYQKQIVL